MSSENFEQFRQIVLSDLLLQKELQRITGRDAFIARLIEIGAERGLDFSSENVAKAMRESRRVWIERWV